jgi:NAD(P)-dependent dehydrogenase (short-subunit alcohol dehydrogenase family)
VGYLKSADVACTSDQALLHRESIEMEKALDFSGKVVIVTGGGKGVGRGISERFLEAGAEVVVCGRSEPDSLPAAAGRQAVFTACDVREYEQIEACVEFAVARFGRLDVLVNNAGGAPHAEAATASPRFSEAIIRLNLIAPLHFSQVANRVMQRQESGGNIINIASVSVLRPSPGTAAYGAAKAGLVNLGASLAVEWAPKVRVNAVVAGLTRTEQSHLHYGDEQGIAAVGATIPLGRMAVPADIGDACLFLASPLASYVSGTYFAVHGGGEKPAFLDAANAQP